MIDPIISSLVSGANEGTGTGGGTTPTPDEAPAFQSQPRISPTSEDVSEGGTITFSYGVVSGSPDSTFSGVLTLDAVDITGQIQDIGGVLTLTDAAAGNYVWTVTATNGVGDDAVASDIKAVAQIPTSEVVFMPLAARMEVAQPLTDAMLTGGGVFMSMLYFHKAGGDTSGTFYVLSVIDDDDTAAYLRMSTDFAMFRDSGFVTADAGSEIADVDGWHVLTAHFRRAGTREYVTLYRDGVQVAAANNTNAADDSLDLYDTLRIANSSTSFGVADIILGEGDPLAFHEFMWNAGAPNFASDYDWTADVGASLVEHYPFYRNEANSLLDVAQSELQGVNTPAPFTKFDLPEWWDGLAHPADGGTFTPANVPAAPTPGAPKATGTLPSFNRVILYETESVVLNFEGAFASDDPITGMSYSGPHPHSWTGQVLTITSTTALGDETEAITATNAYGSSSVNMNFDSRVSPPVLSAVTANLPVDFYVEPGTVIPAFAFSNAVADGIPPYNFTKLSGPTWVVVDRNGVIYGKPDAVAAQTAITVRCTDQRGDVVDLSVNVTVESTWPRTGGEVASTDGTVDLRTQISAASGNGRVLTLNPATVYSNFSNNPFGTGWSKNQRPLIVSGGTGQTRTTISAKLELNGVQNILFENCIFTGMLNFANAASRIWFKNCIFEGSVVDITDSLAQNPTWWGTADDFVYSGILITGMDDNSTELILQDCLLQFFNTGINLRGDNHCLYDVELKNMRDDGFILFEAVSGVALVNVRSGNHAGNYQTDAGPGPDHRDAGQAFNQGVDSLKASSVDVVFDGVLLSSPTQAQGFFMDNKGLPGYPSGHSLHTVDEIYNSWSFKNVAVAISPGSPHWLTLDSIFNLYMDRVALVPAPGSSNSLGELYAQGPLYGEMSNMLLATLDRRAVTQQGPEAGFAIHVQKTNIVDLTGWVITDIFPNWNDPNAETDPRIAGVNAQLWIDPAGAWNTANPDVGPTWMRV